ncbi:MAG: hypothetical protein GY913_05995 [Proteobacteria bacterium]|nr:hypothetical protein [Pseudomonadota bacterium]
MTILLLFACSKDWSFYTTAPDVIPVTSEDSGDPNTDTGDPVEGDADGDGHRSTEDCDDNDPDAWEFEDWYADDDADGFGDPLTLTEDCGAPVDSWVLEPGDCDDTDANIHPNAPEICDGIDNDCDVDVDDADDSVDPSTQTLWYTDLDGDGFGDDATGLLACSGLGLSDVGGDCDDDNVDIHPDATEVCNDVDDDCDSLIDDDDTVDATTGTWYYIDADGDGYGDQSTSLQACAKPDGYKANKKDCDDDDADVNPDADELCDGVDNDCDSSTSEDGTIDLGGVLYTDIQDALDDSLTGDTITVCDGTYNVTLENVADVTLESANGSATTILDGSSTSKSIIKTANNLTVIGFTFQNGDAPVGGGIDAFTNSVGDLTIEDCIFDSNAAVYGGGVAGPQDHDLTVTDSEFYDNEASASGGALYFFDGTMSGTLVHDNDADFGGGLFIDDGYSVTADSTTEIYDNAATYGGGAMLSGGSLTDAYLYNNDADNGGGVLMTLTGASMDGCTVEDNTADYGAGVLTEDYASLTISNSDLSSNVASYGGGLYVYGSTLTVSSTTLDGNTANYGGGALIHGGGTVTISGSTVTTNGATGGGNGGGAILFDGRMESSSTNWGSGSTDNSPEDIYSYDGSKTHTGTTGTFNCTATSCN